MPKDTKPEDQGRDTSCNSVAAPNEAGDAARRDETLRRMLVTAKGLNAGKSPLLKKSD